MKRNRHFTLLAILVILLLVVSLSDISVEARHHHRRRRHRSRRGRRSKEAKEIPTGVPPPPTSPTPLTPPTPLTSPTSPPVQGKAGTSKLKVGFYAGTPCQNVESVVRAEVTNRAKRDPSIIPQLLRIYFHDCFADSQCDASLLIKQNKATSVKTELSSTSNEGVRGLEFIDFLKRKVLASCGNNNLVSCADIIALATRDAVALATGRAGYKIPTGRLDGKVSLMANANSLPGARQAIKSIVARFKLAGFSPRETVILSGAHTIGETRCKFFDDRLYKWSITKSPDPSMDKALITDLRKFCSNTTATANNRVFLDQGAKSGMVFDKSYFVQLTMGRGVLESDQKLFKDSSTKAFVKPLADGTTASFAKKFEAAMIKLGNLGALTVQGSKGDIRKVCSQLN